jgi:hypothetical protein
MEDTSITFPIDVPSFLSSVFERLPCALEAPKSEVAIHTAVASIIECPLIRSAVIAFRASVGLCLERLAQGSRYVCNLEAHRASSVVGDCCKIRRSGQIVAHTVSTKGVLVVIVIEANRKELEWRSLRVHSEVLKT